MGAIAQFLTLSPPNYGKIFAMMHPLRSGEIIASPGCHFRYRVIGPCCRLFDRAQLPWPCCRLQWRGKEPSWRRIGRQFVLDMATRGHPTYSVEFLEPGHSRRDRDPLAEPHLLTLYWAKLSPLMSEWWYSDRVKSKGELSPVPPHPLPSEHDAPLAIASQPAMLVTTSNSGGGAVDSKIEG